MAGVACQEAGLTLPLNITSSQKGSKTETNSKKAQKSKKEKNLASPNSVISFASFSSTLKNEVEDMLTPFPSMSLFKYKE